MWGGRTREQVLADVRAKSIQLLHECLRYEGVHVVDISALPAGERANVDFCSDYQTLPGIAVTLLTKICAIAGMDGYVALMPIERADANITAYDRSAYEEGDTFMRCIAVQGTNPITRLRALDHIYPRDM